MPRSKIVLTVFIDSVDGMLDIWLEAVPPHELIPSQYELLAVNARDEVAVTQIFKHAFASLSELLWLVCKCDEVASERACFAIDGVRVSDGTRDVSAVANYVSQKINEATCDIRGRERVATHAAHTDRPRSAGWIRFDKKYATCTIGSV